MPTTPSRSLLQPGLCLACVDGRREAREQFLPSGLLLDFPSESTERCGPPEERLLGERAMSRLSQVGVEVPQRRRRLCSQLEPRARYQRDACLRGARKASLEFPITLLRFDDATLASE